MNWKKLFKAWLKVLIQFGLVSLVMWFIKCVILKTSLEFTEPALAYLLAEAAERYYDKS